VCSVSSIAPGTSRRRIRFLAVGVARAARARGQARAESLLQATGPSQLPPAVSQLSSTPEDGPTGQLEWPLFSGMGREDSYSRKRAAALGARDECNPCLDVSLTPRSRRNLDVRDDAHARAGELEPSST